MYVIKLYIWVKYKIYTHLIFRQLFTSANDLYEKKHDPEIKDVKSVLMDPAEKEKLEKLKKNIEVPVLVSL